MKRDLCGGELKTGMTMFAGRRHWECHTKAYGEPSENPSLRQVGKDIAEALDKLKKIVK